MWRLFHSGESPVSTRKRRGKDTHKKGKHRGVYIWVFSYLDYFKYDFKFVDALFGQGSVNI